MPARSPRPRSPRRGVTLVEMLVTVALLVLMMTVIVQIFAAATGAVSASKVYQDLDSSLRQLDSMIRTDLSNVTARLTPPLDPKNNLGYFEYGENSHADLQGEDTDDYVRFTAKAPEGQLFTGRVYCKIPTTLIASPTAAQLKLNASFQPITVTSQYAEIIYFLRNGNLYRRVLLVAPERQNSIIQTQATFTAGAFGTGNAGIASWQGVNDLSAHPIPVGAAVIGGTTLPIILNSLGDLTNRENRAFYSRWSSDFVINSTGKYGPDGRPDDENLDTVPDFYPSLYFNLVNPGVTGYYKNPVTGNLLVNEVQSWPNGNPRSVATSSMMAFPYTFPGAYSKPDPGSAKSGLGWIHTPDPSIDQTTVAGLKAMNHNPIDLGDSLPTPGQGVNAKTFGGTQNWWGFPTWRETLNPNWVDPYSPVQFPFASPGPPTAAGQPNGLDPTASASTYPPTFAATNVLPPMDGSYLNVTPFRVTPQYLADPYSPSATNFSGGSTTFAAVPTPTFSSTDLLWRQSWEDDLIATGVRSFDVKAYDNTFAGYVDLGWADDFRIPGTATPGYLSSTPVTTTWAGGTVNTLASTLAHEGRIPPLSTDNRPDAQYPTLSTNVGDDTASIVRLRRVWDSWSTDYSNAPANGVNSDPTSPAFSLPVGPPFSLPIYPSYSAPYPTPLRGIQIQIRMVDPRNERVKVLTIRQDFSDKL